MISGLNEAESKVRNYKNKISTSLVSNTSPCVSTDIKLPKSVNSNK